MNAATKLPGDVGPIHFVGIGGIGMSGIAEVLLNRIFHKDLLLSLGLYQIFNSVWLQFSAEQPKMPRLDSR